MGVDKFAMRIEGRTMWERMMEELSSYFDEVHIACRPDQVEHFSGQRLIIDEHLDIGPMGAIHASLRNLQREDHIFFIACDLPDFKVSVAQVLHAHLSPDYDVVAAFNTERESAEPLVAFWSMTALPLIEEFISKENYALFKCMSQLQVKEVSIKDSSTLRNVNRPSDL